MVIALSTLRIEQAHVARLKKKTQRVCLFKVGFEIQGGTLDQSDNNQKWETLSLFPTKIRHISRLPQLVGTRQHLVQARHQAHKQVSKNVMLGCAAVSLRTQKELKTTSWGISVSH